MIFLESFRGGSSEGCVQSLWHKSLEVQVDFRNLFFFFVVVKCKLSKIFHQTLDQEARCRGSAGGHFVNANANGLLLVKQNLRCISQSRQIYFEIYKVCFEMLSIQFTGCSHYEKTL